MSFSRDSAVWHINKNGPISFDKAVATFEDTKPIRGTSIRPLGDRRKKYDHLVRVDEDTYSLVYHNTHCVTLKRDGRILIRSGGYDTPSTACFISDALRCIDAGSYKTDGKVWVRYNKPYSVVRMPLPTATALEFQLVGDELVPLFEERYPVLRQDTDKAKGYTKLYKHFINWCKPILKLSDNNIQAETLIEYNDTDFSKTDISNWWNANVALKYEAMHSLWHNGMLNGDTDLVKWLKAEDESQYMKMLCFMTQRFGRIAGQNGLGAVQPMAIAVDTIRQALYNKLVKNNSASKRTEWVNADADYRRDIAW
ncbi:MAG: hypothetical protein KGI88_07910 [Betaproteobacteria bacterium]|nr:hypothetical protein [Betaproteobacteria bacterium]